MNFASITHVSQKLAVQFPILVVNFFPLEVIVLICKKKNYNITHTKLENRVKLGPKWFKWDLIGPTPKRRM